MPILFFILALTFADTNKLTNKESEKKVYTYSKSPKSLFLIKRSKNDLNIGEPSIYYSDLQKSNIANDDRMTYKP